MSNFRDGYFERGAPAGGLMGTAVLAADNQAVSLDGISQLQITSDNTTATNRTFTLSPGTLLGQKVTLIMESGASTKCELANSGNVKLTAAWTPTQYQALRLEWDGTYWIEEGRSNVTLPATTALTSGQIFVGDGSNLAADVAVTGDISIDNTGLTAIATGVIVNADVKSDAAIALSKLAAMTSGYVLVGSAATVPTAVALAGDVTVVAAGTTTIGASKVLSTMISSSDGAMKCARYTVLYSDLNTAGSGVAFVAGVTIPDNAIIYQALIDVTTTFVGDGDDSTTIAVGIENQTNDLVTAVAIKTGTPWDIGIQACIPVGTAASAIKLTAARQLAVTASYVATDTTLTAGAMEVFVFYMVASV